MRVKDIVDENFQDYKKTSMFICTSFCDGKCYRELGLDSSICQNESIQCQPIMNIPDEEIVDRYMNNPITSAIVIGGLEPFEQFKELYELIRKFRERTDDDIVIYTGYNENELTYSAWDLARLKNIIIKYGRYIPNSTPKYDYILGVTLASDNQYAVKIS